MESEADVGQVYGGDGEIKTGARDWPVHLQKLFVIVYSVTLLKVAPIHWPAISAVGLVSA